MIKTITFCDKCKKEVKRKNDHNDGLIRFEEEYDITAKKLKTLKIDGQKINVIIKIEKECGEDGEICDKCASKIFKQSFEESSLSWTK